MTDYYLRVSQEDGLFLGTVAGLPGATYGATISEVQQGGREIVILAQDLPEDAQFNLVTIAVD